MYKFIHFKDIDKNKWNGAIHYATNGNIFGYHWYLKAVLKEWDAIIEDDYESVIPILKKPLYQEQYGVLPFLGPYSVNYLNQTRFKSLIEPLSQNSQTGIYPLNFDTPRNLLESIPTKIFQFWKLDTRDNYDAIKDRYGEEILTFLTENGLSNVKLNAGIKPEQIVETKKTPAFLKNTYLRIMYNAMHRGIGFSNAILDQQSGAIRSVSFYLLSHNSIHELFHYSTGPEYRWVLLDLLIQNQAGKPIKIFTYDLQKNDQTLGFEKMTGYRYETNQSIVNRIRKKFGMTY